ncbi:hypothetical protein L9F63_000462, partial [Diploptera punctata]
WRFHRHSFIVLSVLVVCFCSKKLNLRQLFNVPGYAATLSIPEKTVPIWGS